MGKKKKPGCKEGIQTAAGNLFRSRIMPLLRCVNLAEKYLCSMLQVRCIQARCN